MAKNERMSNEIEHGTGDTVRLHRPPPRVFTDALGRNVWMGDIELIELEPEQSLGTDPYNSASKVTNPWSKI